MSSEYWQIPKPAHGKSQQKLSDSCHYSLLSVSSIASIWKASHALVINVSCCNKIILQKYENDRVDSLRDMDMNLNIHLQARVQMNTYACTMYMR